MSGYARHLRVRLGAVLRSPGALAVIVLGGLATLLFSPSLPLYAGPDPTSIDAIAQPLITIQWLWMVPALITRAVTGRTTGPLWSAYQPAAPSLPVSIRMRVLAEVSVVGGLLLVARLPGFALAGLAEFVPGLPDATGGSFPAAFGSHWLVGALCLLPVAAAWASPAPSGGVLFVRPLVAASAMYLAGHLGLLDGIVTGVTATALVGGLVLWTTGRERVFAVSARRFVRPTQHWRIPAPGPERLRRDHWELPLERNRVWLIVIGLGLATWLGLDLAGLLPPNFWHLGASLALGGLLGLVVMRPMGSPLPMAGFTGSSGYGSGAFVAAWRQLPVRPEALLRGVYLHGLVTAGALWALMVGLVVLRTWLHHGALGLYDADGDSVARLLLPAVVAAPLLASLLTAAAVGDQLRSWLAAGSLVAFMPAMLFGLLAGETWLGGQPGLALAATSAVALVLLAVGGLPALSLLKDPAQSYSR
jgi:hypothetical protein